MKLFLSDYAVNELRYQAANRALLAQSHGGATVWRLAGQPRWAKALFSVQHGKKLAATSHFQAIGTFPQAHRLNTMM